MRYHTSALIGAALAAAVPAAHAQSTNVSLYGLLDDGIEYVRGSAGADGKTYNELREGYGTAPSRLGLRGSEDLGGGLSVVFTLESGLSVDTGALSQGGRLFGRQGWVGLSGSWGTLSVGRQYTMRYYGMLDADIFAASQQGLGSLDSGIPNARADNSVSYRATVGAVTAGVNFSTGRDTVSANNPTATNCPGEAAADHKQCREWSAMAKYDGGSWGVVGAYERQYGGTAATYGGLTSSKLTDTRYTLNAYTKVGATRYGAGWLRRINDASATPKSNLYWAVLATPLTQAVSFDGMLAMNKFEDSPNQAVLLTLRAIYHLSKRTGVYLSASNMANSGALAAAVSTNSPSTGPLPGHSQQSLMLGVRHAF